MTHLYVDGTGVAHRCWWASASGCTDRFRSIIEKASPSKGAKVSVCWDGAGSWRRDLFPGYKANRPPKPQALAAALEECRRLFPGFVAEGFEADDLLATFARDAAQNGTISEVSMVLSDDKDLLQLAGPRCLVIRSTGEIFDAEAVQKKMGVPPSRIRHLLSWMGDKVDGLPGVPGYGPKRAAAMARDGKIGNELTFDLAELAMVPSTLIRSVAKWEGVTW